MGKTVGKQGMMPEQKAAADLSVIHALWVGSSLSLLERVSLASFVHHGHRVCLYCYEDVGAVPAGVEVHDASEVLGREELYTYPNGSYAAFANLFRWEVLYRKGGIWVDTDVVCLKPFGFKGDYIFGWQNADVINNAVVGLPVGSELAEEMADRCRRPNLIRKGDSLEVLIRKFRRRFFEGNQRGNIKWGEGGGVYAFSDAVKQAGLEHYALPVEAFYPVPPEQWDILVQEGSGSQLEAYNGSFAVHLWNERYRSRNVSKNGPFPQRSFLGECASIYLPADCPHRLLASAQ